MKVTPIAAVLFAIVSVVTANWNEAAKEACQKVGKTFDGRNIVIKNQCVVRCVAHGELPAYERVADGTACEMIFRRRIGVCMSGICIDQ
ncbi:hypothetical protein B0O80DRAFT_439057 [Mortierella sp. GBAus27b]|nr:hypothetical protein B0O80DRAFT_439057 [Mortierella sp. GBAus27b]